MRPKLLLGWGLAGVMAAAVPAAGQFAVDRPAVPPPTPVPPTAQPAAGQPAAAPEAHPWYVRAEHGRWMICVKSYSGPVAKSLAEELAKEIRETYRVPAYLFEKGADERKKQEEFVARERERQRAQQQAFLTEMDRLRKESAERGIEFMESAPRLRVPRYQTIDEQWAVLVGGWKDMETTRKELDKIRTWQPPKNEQLVDHGLKDNPGQDGRQNVEVTAINPFRYAIVVPNPAAPKAETDDGMVRTIYKLNENEELSVLRIAKPWTLVVKAFHPPIKIRDYGAEKSVVEKASGRGDASKELGATALQAASMAKALRDPKFQPHPFDAYVLHTIHGSLVCVGQYDGPDDPAMAQAQRVLDGIRFKVERQDQFTTQQNVRLFDPMFALQIPKAK